MGKTSKRVIEAARAALAELFAMDEEALRKELEEYRDSDIAQSLFKAGVFGHKAETEECVRCELLPLDIIETAPVGGKDFKKLPSSASSYKYHVLAEWHYASATNTNLPDSSKGIEFLEKDLIDPNAADDYSDGYSIAA